MKENMIQSRTGMTKKNVLIVVAVTLAMMSTGAFAADEIGGGICNFVNMLTGKWLFGFTMLAILGGGAAILFGAEISDGIKKIATIVTVVGLILGSSQILTLAFSRFNGMTC